MVVVDPGSVVIDGVPVLNGAVSWAKEADELPMRIRKKQAMVSTLLIFKE